MGQNPETLQKGLALHNSGDLQQAEQEYQKILRLDPRHADALHLIGVIGQQRGEPALAIEYIGKAIAVNRSNAVYHTNLAAAHQTLSRFRDAEQCCRQAIRLQPRYAEAHYNLALALESQQRPDAAAEEYRRAIELKPSIAEAHLNLGNVLRSQQKMDEAEECFRKAIEVRPQYAAAHNNLGNLYDLRGDADAAIAAFRRALECDPNYFEPQYALASVLQSRHRIDEAIEAFERAQRLNPARADVAARVGGALLAAQRLEEAAAAFEQSIAINPHDEATFNSLGQVCQQLGRLEEAEQSFRRAIAIQPKYGTAWNNLGVVCHARNQTPAAILCFRKALEFEEGHVQANVNLGSILKNTGELAEAAACFDRALARDPGNATVRILKASLFPQVYSSVEELAECRRMYKEEIESLNSSNSRLDPDRELLPNIFYLPYQGQNDRDLQGMLARLYPVPVSPPPFRVSYAFRARSTGGPNERVAGRAERIRIGFVSHHFRAHTIGHLMQGMIAQLSRERFSVTVLSIGEHHDELAGQIRKSADEYVVLPTTPKRAREIVAGCKLDVLFYADIGMDAWSYSLAFHRLARVQCVTWGHPVTTGIPNVDYFISSELLEPDDADGHYTENLVRLSGLPTYYYRPAAPAQSRDRASYGIPEGCHLYLCPQSLFKFHPEFDVLLKEILRRDPQGRLVLVEGIEPAWTQKLRERFRQNLGVAADRVQFLPRQVRDEFLNLMRLCDVMLDPLHFGGGNTTYEALAQGVPIVTFPSPYMRGRVTAACYKKMGLADCIAGSPREYVDLAVRLATEPDSRKCFSTRILAANHVLYEDRQSLDELEDFLEIAIERARGGQEARREEASRREQATTTGNSRAAMPAVIMHEAQSEIVSRPALVDLLRTATCPACGHHVAVPFYDGGEQPLATVAWPRNAADARSMKQLPLEFLRCVDCGHVYNCRFDYAEVPYSQKPNLMFNKGAVWTDHLREIRDLILKVLPDQPTVVEVGCGEGHLLRALAIERPQARYVGFDPSNAINRGNGLIEGRRELFVPAKHLAELRPDLIVSRHVLEHLMNPLGFVQAISFAASWENIETRLFIEVPCIDHVIRLGRTVDFFYEHNSNFTMISLERLLRRCASDVEVVARSYNDEVVYGVAQFRRREDQVRFATEAAAFGQRASRNRQAMRADIDRLAESGRRVAIWGGTGKAAAFINQFGLDARRFPLVIDSDLEKAGTYVPGTGQEILYRDFLLQYPADVIVIATQWRAGDIVAEIERCGITYQTIVLEHEGRLVDYFAGAHPYRAVSKAA